MDVVVVAAVGGTWLDFLSGKRIWKFQFSNVKPFNFPVGVSTVRIRQCSALWPVWCWRLRCRMSWEVGRVS